MLSVFLVYKVFANKGINRLPIERGIGFLGQSVLGIGHGQQLLFACGIFIKRMHHGKGDEGIRLTVNEEDRQARAAHGFKR